jgi:excisionase family DNA binding protein
MDQFLTKADAAKVLEVTPAAVVAMHTRGDLAAVRTTGGVRLFSQQDVERLAAKRRRVGSAARESAAVNA